MKHTSLLEAAPFSGSRVQPFDGTRRYLSTGDLQEARTSFVEVTYTDKPSRADISVRPGDVLFARMKGTKKVLEIDRSLADIIVSTGFAVIRPTEHCNGKYLSIYLKSADFERQKEKYCFGAIQPAITNAGINRLTIPFPPLDDQKRIAHLLGKVEELITRRRQHLQQLDDLLKSVFLEMFGDPVRNEKGWAIEPLARLITHQPSNGLYKPQSSYGSGTKIIRIDSFYNGYVQGIDSLKRVEIANSEYERYRIEADDILINRVNSIEYLGKIGIVPDIDEAVVYESNMMKFRVDTQVILPVFLMFVWRLPFVKSQIAVRAKKAVNQASINQKDVLSFVLPRPPISLQRQFAAIVEKVEALKSRYQQSLTDLESLYGALSQKAFKGELDLWRVMLPVDSIGKDTEGLNRKREVLR